ncbi:hypothetical protein NP233_g4811 [Leucocoprinus birnbaumii]|uniref:C2H2-type domain-containing protein n=1 Tax=Leucocoprinus birnbaumii TaxID=56174 RepID=A0AAD5VU45_9AGAR|nr:hypothetical protein NP233_g4811 [Leucocoprinus birnbaumii]
MRGFMPRNNKIQENPVHKPAGDDARSPSIPHSLFSASGEPSPLVLPSPAIRIVLSLSPTISFRRYSPYPYATIHPYSRNSTRVSFEELSSPLEPFYDRSPSLALELDQDCNDDHMHYEDDLEVFSQRSEVEHDVQVDDAEKGKEEGNDLDDGADGGLPALGYPEDHQEGAGMMTDYANGATATDNQRLPGEGPFEFPLNLITEPSTHDAAGREVTPRLRTDLKNVNIHPQPQPKPIVIDHDEDDDNDDAEYVPDAPASDDEQLKPWSCDCGKEFPKERGLMVHRRYCPMWLKDHPEDKCRRPRPFQPVEADGDRPHLTRATSGRGGVAARGSGTRGRGRGRGRGRRRGRGRGGGVSGARGRKCLPPGAIPEDNHDTEDGQGRATRGRAARRELEDEDEDEGVRRAAPQIGRTANPNVAKRRMPAAEEKEENMFHHEIVLNAENACVNKLELGFNDETITWGKAHGRKMARN